LSLAEAVVWRVVVGYLIAWVISIVYHLEGEWIKIWERRLLAISRCLWLQLVHNPTGSGSGDRFLPLSEGILVRKNVAVTIRGLWNFEDPPTSTRW
jgi:hypothetical protein